MDNTIKETHILGIDIAKHKFDVALIVNGKHKNKVFGNNELGFAELTGWLTQHHVSPAHACMDDCMDAGVRATQERLPRRQAAIGKPWRPF
jgi:transposase